ALKNRLLAQFAESPECELQHLRQNIDTTGLKPMEILVRMRRLAPGLCNESTVRALFMNEMPSTIRPLLAVWKENDLSTLAKTADKILETSKAGNIASVDAISQATKGGNRNPILDVMLDSIKQLQREVKSIMNDNSTSRSCLQSSSATKHGQDDYCWYHQKLGNAARKCRPGCEFTASSN
ncbi:hypothetical protein KR067_007740, partial [Drosophila pandora]